MNIEQHLKSHILKQKDSSVSSNTHLNLALFSVIETFSDTELDELFEDDIFNSGGRSIIEGTAVNYKNRGLDIPEKYARFIQRFILEYIQKERKLDDIYDVLGDK